MTREEKPKKLADMTEEEVLTVLLNNRTDEEWRELISAINRQVERDTRHKNRTGEWPK